jgi:hypothetical protein
MRNDITKRADKAKVQDAKYREMPDIVVKVVCRYRAELFFKISRKTKLSRLFNAWTDRMEKTGGKKGANPPGPDTMNGSVKSDAVPPSGPGVPSLTMQFVFTHNGRTVEADQTPEEAGMEDADEILAVELMDLTEGPGSEEWVSNLQSSMHPYRSTLLGRFGGTSAAKAEEELDGQPSRVRIQICFPSRQGHSMNDIPTGRREQWPKSSMECKLICLLFVARPT